MDKQKADYATFLLDVPPTQHPYVETLHRYMLENGYQTKVAPSKSGYVVSYAHGDGDRVLANYIFRKAGVMIRIYADHVGEYQQFLETLPAADQAKIEKASVCRRLLDPTKCNARCPMGNVFTLNGNEHKKCRYNNFMFLVDERTTPYLQTFLEHEMHARASS